MNVGASAPWDAGLYFSWGNIEGVSADDAEAVAAMTEVAYASTHGASVHRDLMSGVDDAASVLMGIDWCMPSHDDLQELIDECDWTWTTIKGVNGYRVSSKAEGNNNSIFLPAAGRISMGSLEDVNTEGYYYSAEISDDKPWMLNMTSVSHSNLGTVTSRYRGLTIRARLA